MDELFDTVPSLRQMSLLLLTKNYWEKSSMKSKILNFFTHTKSWTSTKENFLSWTKEILDEIQRDKMLPFAVKKLLIDTIKPIGERLINFIDCITSDLAEKNNTKTYPSLKNYIDNIYWTNHGTIDEVKIFKVIYNGSRPDDRIQMDMIYMYKQAAKNYMKDFVESIWNELSEVQQIKIYPMSEDLSDIYFRNDSHHVRKILLCYKSPSYNNNYWQWYHHRELIENSEYYGALIIRNTMIQEIQRANYLGVKYMFHLLEKNGEDLRQKESIEKAANKQGKNVSSQQDLFGIKSMDIVMLLRKKTKEPIFLIDAEILSLISVSWPWKYEFFDIFQSNPSYHDLVKDIIEFIAPKIVEEMALYGIIKHTSCWIIKGILKIIPNDLEKNYIKLFHFLMDDVIGKNTDIIEALYILLQSDDDDYNDDNGECVFNGEQQAFRLHLKKFYTHLLIREKYEIIEFFMEKSMPHEGLKIHFKEQWNDAPLVYQYFMYHQKHNAAEKFLDWQFEAEYEKNYYKRTYNCENSKNFFD